MWKTSETTAAHPPREESFGSKTATRVIIADPNQLAIDGMTLLLQENSDTLVSSVNSIGELVEELRSGQRTDIAMINLANAGDKEVQAVMMVSSEFPLVKALVFAAPCKPTLAAKLIEAGVKGFVSEEAHAAELLFAVHQVVQGKKFLCSRTAFALLDASTRTIGSVDAVISQLSLSKREMEILKLIAEGYTNSEIGDKLFTSRRTVETHRKSLIQKTGSKNTASLIRFAVNHGLV